MSGDHLFPALRDHRALFIFPVAAHLHHGGAVATLLLEFFLPPEQDLRVHPEQQVIPWKRLNQNLDMPFENINMTQLNKDELNIYGVHEHHQKKHSLLSQHTFSDQLEQNRKGLK